jgi:hypothetical protein
MVARGPDPFLSSVDIVIYLMPGLSTLEKAKTRTKMDPVVAHLRIASQSHGKLKSVCEEIFHPVIILSGEKYLCACLTR